MLFEHLVMSERDLRRQAFAAVKAAGATASAKAPETDCGCCGGARGGEGLALGGEGLVRGGEGLALGGEAIALGSEGTAFGGAGLAVGGAGLAGGGGGGKAVAVARPAPWRVLCHCRKPRAMFSAW